MGAVPKLGRWRGHHHLSLCLAACRPLDALEETRLGNKVRKTLLAGDCCQFGHHVDGRHLGGKEALIYLTKLGKSAWFERIAARDASVCALSSSVRCLLVLLCSEWQ